MLVDPEQTAVPVTHAKYGKTYHMYLENFPASTTLQLDLYRFKVHTRREMREGGRGEGKEAELIIGPSGKKEVAGVCPLS